MLFFFQEAWSSIGKQIELLETVQAQFELLGTNMQSTSNECLQLLPEMKTLDHRIDIGFPLESSIGELDNTALTQVKSDHNDEGIFRDIAAGVFAHFTESSSGPQPAQNGLLMKPTMQKPKSLLEYVDFYDGTVGKLNVAIRNFNQGYNMFIVPGSNARARRFVESSLSDIINQCRIETIYVQFLLPSSVQPESIFDRAANEALVRATRRQALRWGLIIVFVIGLCAFIAKRWFQSRRKNPRRKTRIPHAR